MARRSSWRKPVKSAYCGMSEMFVPMLKPLVTSSIVTGETPVMNRRATGASVPVVAALSFAKKSLKKPSPWHSSL